MTRTNDGLFLNSRFCMYSNIMSSFDSIAVSRACTEVFAFVSTAASSIGPAGSDRVCHDSRGAFVGVAFGVEPREAAACRVPAFANGTSSTVNGISAMLSVRFSNPEFHVDSPATRPGSELRHRMFLALL